MKHIFVHFLIFSIILFSFPLNRIQAQGIYQIYGSTAIGGSFEKGVIFSLDSAGNNYRERFSIGLSVNGKTPLYGAPVYFNGKFYGACSAGGGSNLGILYAYDPVTHVLQKKIDFNRFNGSSPQGGLTLYNNKLYGMCYAGGLKDSGIIYQWDPVTNIIEKKIEFSKSKGSNPAGSLLLSGNKFYGLTSRAGQFDKGTIFSWDPQTNQFTKLADFNGTNGANPLGSLIYANSKFYGMCYAGGSSGQGSVFEYDPASSQLTVKANLGSSTGYYPYGSFTLLNSKLYGMTTRGGVADFGTILEYDLNTNTLTKKVDFALATGGFAYGDLVYNGQGFYGFTGFGATNFFGGIFEWNPVTNTFSNLYSFTALDGKNPAGTPVILNGKLYGTTKDGGLNSVGGSFFEFDPANSSISQVSAFNEISSEKRFAGSLTNVNGKLFSLTNLDPGAIVEWDPSAEAFSNRYTMVELTGIRPYGSLTLYNNKLYGTNQLGGSNFKGNIFAFDPVTGDYEDKIDLDDDKGFYPLGELVMLNGKFYGTCTSGGTNQTGVLFEWDPVSNTYLNRFEFPVVDNQWPYGFQPESGLEAYNGKLYGTTRYGGLGNDDKGVLFEWNPTTNTVTNLFNFSGINGENPVTTPVAVDGNLFGVTSEGGANGVGVIYQFNLQNNSFTKRIDFGNDNGAYPQGKLLFAHGKFYGMTNAGGNNSFGCIYEWDPSSNILSRKKDFTASGAKNPDGNGLTYFPAPVAKGIAGNCTTAVTVNINSTNNNQWVAFTDSQGDAIAEINANGNILGQVSVSFYINKDEVREDENHRLYLDRNISITPEFQPSTPVSIRVYITRNEFETLKNAFNSLGQSSGIQTPDDLAIFTNSIPCAANIQTIASQINGTVSSWNQDFVLTASVNHFSSFYISNKAYSVIPVRDLKFEGNWKNQFVVLTWKATGEENVSKYVVERKLPGDEFLPITFKPALNQSNANYAFTDSNLSIKTGEFVLYRIKLIDNDGKFTYSKILRFQRQKDQQVLIYPNPCKDYIHIRINENSDVYAFINLLDNNGRLLKQVKSETGSVDISLEQYSDGIFFLKFSDGHVEKILKLK